MGIIIVVGIGLFIMILSVVNYSKKSQHILSNTPQSITLIDYDQRIRELTKEKKINEEIIYNQKKELDVLRKYKNDQAIRANLAQVNYEKTIKDQFSQFNNELNESLTDKSRAYKWLAGMIADYQTIAEEEYIEILNKSLSIKNQERSMKITDLKREKKRLIEENKILKYEINYQCQQVKGPIQENTRGVS